MDELTSAESPIFGTDEHEPTFRRSFIWVFAAHIALVSVLPLIGKQSKPIDLAGGEQITWMDADALLAAAAPPSSAPEQTQIPEPLEEPTEREPLRVPPEEPQGPEPLSEPPPPTPEEPLNSPVAMPASEKSELEKPEPPENKTLPPAEKPKVSQPAKMKPKAVETRANKSLKKPFVTSGKKNPERDKVMVKVKAPAPKPMAKVERDTSKKPGPTGNAQGEKISPGTGAATAGNTSTGAGSGGGSLNAEHSAYYRSIAERFRAVWDKPVTVESAGRRVTAYVHISVSADGTMRGVHLEQSSGSREVDESIQAAFPRFKNVAPPPASLLSGGIMDQTMEIKLDL